MTSQVVKVRRETIAACMTCPLCNKLLKEATTISLCLHTCKSYCYVSLFWLILIWALVILHFSSWVSFTLCFYDTDFHVFSLCNFTIHTCKLHYCLSLFWPILIWPFVLLHFINWASFTLCFRGMDLMSFMQFQNSYVFVSQSPFSLLCCFWSGFVLSFHYMNWVPSALCFHDLGSHVLFHIRILVLWTGFRFVNYIEEKREMLCVYDVDVIILSFFLFVNLGNKEQ